MIIKWCHNDFKWSKNGANKHHQKIMSKLSKNDLKMGRGWGWGWGICLT